ncbi:MAG: peptidase M22 [Clostridia bacterium]|nr:peptidase M22 [Clostridia bacterium]
MLFCGIDTSNYTTSAALCDGEGNIIANIKKPLPVKDGDCGLRQSDAVFAHVKNLPEVMRTLSEVLDGNTPDAIGVSYAPRTAEGSYMPCFLTGIAAAESMSAGNGAPVFRFSHQQGHIMAAYHTSGAEAENASRDEFLAFHVSGGTTELLKVKPLGEGFDVALAGGTEDLNAGQAIDRVGVALGLHFPCGPEMDRLAHEYVGEIKGVRVSVNGMKCNLSGLQNLAVNMIQHGEDPCAVCAFVFTFIGKTLYKMALNAREICGDLPIVWAGGVMSNSIIKTMLSGLGKVYFAEPQYSADNAVGTALLCREKFLRGRNV